MTDVPASFIGRTWLLQRVGDWLNDPHGGSLLITGDPGSGKTELAAHLVRMAKGADPAPEFLRELRLHAAHFCKVELSDSISGHTVIAHLSKQLIDTVPGYLQTLRDQQDPAATRKISVNLQLGSVTGGTVEMNAIRELHLSTHHHRETYDALIRRPLRALNTSVTLLIDGVDEARASDHGRHILDLLSDELAEPVPELRWLALGRSKPVAARIARFMDARIDLQADQPENIDEITPYVAARLKGLPTARRTRLAASIADRADGNFLYARFVTEEILAGGRADGALPGGLTQIYEQFLDREVRAHRERWRTCVHPVLAAIAVSYGDGLTRRQLARVTCLHKGAVDEAISVCGPYLRASSIDGPLRLYHSSLRDHLLTPVRRVPSETARPGDDITEPGDRQIDPDRARSAIIDGLRTQWAGRWRECDDPYVLNHLLEHVVDMLVQDPDQPVEVFDDVGADPGFLCAVLASEELAYGFLRTLSRARWAELPNLRETVDVVHLITSRYRAMVWINVEKAPGLVLSTLAHLAHLLGRADYAVRIDRYLDQQGLAGLRTRWTTDHQSPVMTGLTDGAQHIVVNIVTVIEDGRRALAGSGDGTIRLWDVPTATMVFSADGHESGITAIAVTADERRAVTGCYDGGLCVWDLTTGELIHRLRSPVGENVRWQVTTGRTSHQIFRASREMIGRIVIAPDDRTAIVGSGTTVELWDLETGEQLETLTGHSHLAMELAVIPDGRILSGDGSEARIIWDSEPGTWPADPNTRLVLWQVLTPGGEHVLTYTGQSLEIHDMATGQDLPGISLPWEPGHGEGSVTSDGKFLIVPTSDYSYQIRELPHGEPVGDFKSRRTLKTQIVESRVENVAVSRTGGYALEGLTNGTIRVHRLGSKSDWRCPPHGDAVTAVAFGTDGETAITAASDGTWRVWDPRTGTFAAHTYLSDDDRALRDLLAERAYWTGTEPPLLELRALAVTPDGATVVGGWSGGAVMTWHRVTGERTGTLMTHQSTVDAVLSLGISDGLVTALSRTAVRAWDLSRQTEVFHTTVPSPSGASITSTGRHALIPTTRGAPQVWDVVAGTVIGELPDGALLCPDGITAVLPGEQVTCWDVRTGRPKHRLPVGTLPETFCRRDALWTSPDGSRLVVLSTEHTASVWDLYSRTLVCELWIPSMSSIVRVSDGGGFLVAASRDGDLGIWELARGTELGTVYLSAEISDLAINPAHPTEVLVGLRSGEVTCLSTDSEVR